MSRLFPLSTAMMLSCLPTTAQAVPVALDSLHLLDQADRLPADFRTHFFDVPLVLRVEKNGRYLGDARALLSRDNALSLLEFIDSGDSPLPPAARSRWLAALSEPRPLGPCVSRCPQGLQRLHYSLENSLLSIATADGGRPALPRRHHALPEGGSRGVVTRHQLNAYGGEGIDVAGRYALDVQASAGYWTVQGRYQLDRGGEAHSRLRQAVQSLYAQREFGDTFLRAGYFLPTFQGVTRQPRAAGSGTFTTVGVMAGSSDSLRIDSRSPSLYPVYVTANREGSVEVYRDGSLILTQALQPGLQALDTQRLPGGIYAVELRVIEDGREASRETALIHKPSHWRDASQRWRYSAFAGVQRSLVDSLDDPQAGEVAAGGVINYLAHARAVLGLAAQRTGSANALAGSLDWQATDWANLYTNAYRSNEDGSGVDVQGLMRYRHGNVIVSHNRSWQTRTRIAGTRAGWLHTRAIGLNHRVGDSAHLAVRVAHNRGVSQGTGVDLSFSRRQTLFGGDATWRASLFNRPGSVSTGLRRNQGVDLTVTVALGRQDRRYSGGLGSRTSVRGRRDLYASAGVQQSFDTGSVQGVAGEATLDREGLGLSGNLQFEQPGLQGDAYAQRSSLGGGLNGGLNLESTLAVGGGRLAVAGSGLAGAADTGMIVDVRSELPDLRLRAYDSRGGSHVLRPGRNLLPVSAYRAGTLQIDFDGRAAPAAAIQPAVLPYHLNKGGVAYGTVEVVRTVTVLGQLRAADGTPLAGAQVLNHAGRSVAEADGFFAMEMRLQAPTLEVRHPRVTACTFVLDGKVTQGQGDTWMAGVLQCPPSGTVDAGTASRATGEAP